MSSIIKIILGIFIFLGIVGGIVSNLLPDNHPFVKNSRYSQNINMLSGVEKGLYKPDTELDGQSEFTGPTQANVSWVTDIGRWGTEAVYGDDGTVYLGKLTSRSSKVGHVFAVNPDGSERWSLNITSDPNSLCNPVPVYISEDYEEVCKPLESNVVSMSRAKDGTIYVGLTLHDTGDLTRPRDFSQSRFVVAINPDGTEKWRLDVGPNDVKSRITVDDQGILYFVAGKANGPNIVSAVDPKEGQVIWNKEFRVKTMNGPSMGKNGILYFGGDKVRAVDSAFGTLIWEYDTKTVAAFPFGPAIGPDGTIYVTSTSDFNLHAINPSGSLNWKINIGFAELIPAIGPDGAIYVHVWEDLLDITDGSPKIKPGLHAIDPDGTIRWSKDGFFQLTENELQDEDILLVGQKFGGSDSSIIIDKNGILYFGTDQGRIYAVDSRDGTIVFEARFRGEFDNRPMISPDGTLVLCHHGGGGLYEGPRCIGINDHGTMKPSPGVLVDDIESGDGENTNSCFDICVDVNGGTNEQCWTQCKEESESLDSLSENNLNSQSYDQCFDICVDVDKKTNAQCNAECDN